MIIFSGHGILIAIFALAGGFAGRYASTHLNSDDPLSLAMVAWGAAIAVLLYALTLGKTRRRTLVDPKTGVSVEIKKRHTLLFLPAMIWAIGLCGVAALITFSSLTGDITGDIPGDISGDKVLIDTGSNGKRSLALDTNSTSAPSPEPVTTPAATPRAATPAVLDLKLVAGNISLSGQLRSEYQIKDIVAALERSKFPLTNNLSADPNTMRVDWGNRVGPLLADLAADVADLHFRVSDGAITITGTVTDAAEKDQLQRAISYVFETSTDITTLNNELQVQ